LENSSKIRNILSFLGREEKMTEEKKEAQCCCSKMKSPAILKLILALVFIVAGAWCFISWWWHFTVVFKGCIGPILILAGLVTLAIAKE